MNPYIFILLSSLCSLLLVHLLKISETRRLRTLPVLTFNYLIAFLFTLVVSDLTDLQRLTHLPTVLIGFILLIGAFFIGNYMVFSKSVHFNGMGISVAAMRLSLLVPVLISIGIYNEKVTTLKFIGLILVFAALFLLLPRKGVKKTGRLSRAWWLPLIFLLSGVADASLKIYEEDFSQYIDEMSFMGLIFLSAFFIGAFNCWFRPGPFFKKQELLMGSLIGIPNLYSAIFLIYALGEIDGAIAYSIVNVLNVTGGTLLGLWWWKDRVSALQWTGIAVALTAIVVLL